MTKPVKKVGPSTTPKNKEKKVNSWSKKFASPWRKFRWFKDVWKASKKPNNIANSLVLAIFLYASVWVYCQLNTTIDFEVYSNFDLEDKMIVESKNETTLYFTLANTGGVPLEIWELYLYTQEGASLNKGIYNNWTRDDKHHLLDENDQPLTKTVLVPMEKLKLHYTFKRPANTVFSDQVISICPFWRVKGFALKYYIWELLSPQTLPAGECFNSYIISWR